MATVESRAAHDWPAISTQTLCHAFQQTVAEMGDAAALRDVGSDSALSWNEYAARVRTIAAGLDSLGVKAGDCVAILLANRLEFHLVDTAILHLGATPFSVYHTNPPEQIAPLLENSDATVMITEQQFADRVFAARELQPTVKTVVVIDDSTGDLDLAGLEAAGADNTDFDFDAAWQATTPDSFATIVYTSGTTGTPKGVQHTHAGLLFGLRSMHSLAPVSRNGRVCSYLPNAHIAERYISHYGSIGFGYAITCVPDPKQLGQALGETRPTRFFGVPRIFEKFRSAVQAIAENDAQLAEAIDASLERVRSRESQDVHAPQEDWSAPIRAKLGYDQAEWIGVAAAPIALEVLEFHHAIGIRIAELWGMSECVLSTSNPPDKIKLGSVGFHLPGVEVKLADDGEIMVRGPQVSPGYRKDPERTAESFTPEGWLLTGDIAAADDDGYFKIVDRKKELIINSAGKNMAPGHIENVVKTECALIAQVVAIGDAKPYVTALIVLDPEAVEGFAAKHSIDGDHAAVSQSDAVRDEIAAAVARANEKLARVEQLKNHTVLPNVWLPGSDEVTPTQKLRRKPIAEKYAAEITALYA